MIKGFGGTFSVISLSVFSCSLFLVNCLVAMIVGNSVWIRVLCTRFWRWAFLSVFCFWACVSWLAYLPTRPHFFLFFFLSQFFLSFSFLLLFSHSFLFYLLQWIKPWKTRNCVNIAYFWDFRILRNWFKIGVKNGTWHLWCLSCKQYIEQRL